MRHSISCTYPEGCSCWASRINRWTKLIRSQEQELATLRAKAEAYDKGNHMVELSFPGSTVRMLIESDNQAVIDIYEKSKGHTCRKVRVCEVLK